MSKRGEKKPEREVHLGGVVVVSQKVRVNILTPCSTSLAPMPMERMTSIVLTQWAGGKTSGVSAGWARIGCQCPLRCDAPTLKRIAPAFGMQVFRGCVDDHGLESLLRKAHCRESK